MTKEVVAAIVTGSFAVITSIGTAIYAYLVTDRQKREHDKALEAIKGCIQEKLAERNARRDYEYEARKRLYEEYEPLFFRFAESCEMACFRITGLANRAAQGYLNKNHNWLKRDDYYLQSTVYYLLAPLANFKLLRGKVNYVDLRLDKGIYSTYILGKILFASFSDAFRIAETMNISYSPFGEQKNPRQDVPIGLTENITEIMIEQDPINSTNRKVMNLAAFQKIVNATEDGDLHFLCTMVRNFHPAHLPVLWRVLMVQTILYKVIERLRKEAVVTNKENLIEEVKNITNYLNFEDFDWRNSEEKLQIPGGEVQEILGKAIRYIQNAIEGLY